MYIDCYYCHLSVYNMYTVKCRIHVLLSCISCGHAGMVMGGWELGWRLGWGLGWDVGLGAELGWAITIPPLSSFLPLSYWLMSCRQLPLGAPSHCLGPPLGLIRPAAASACRSPWLRSAKPKPVFSVARAAMRLWVMRSSQQHGLKRCEAVPG